MKQWMSRVTVFGVWLGLVCVAVGGSVVVRSPYSKALRPEKSSDRGAGVFELDEAVFDAASAGYANLRVVDEENREASLLVRPRTRVKKVVRLQILRTKNVDLARRDDNSASLVVEVEGGAPGPAPHALVVLSAQRNFEKKVSVFGSNDRETWELLAADQAVFDYSKNVDLKNTRVDFPPASYLYYRVDISTLSESEVTPLTTLARETRAGVEFSEKEHMSFRRKDFRIDGVVLEQNIERTTSDGRFPRAYELREVEVEQKVLETQVSFETGRAPLTGLVLTTDSRNFSRRVKVEGYDETPGASGWRNVAAGTISSIRLGSLVRDSLDINFGRALRYPRYRLTIVNEDNPSLLSVGVTARGEVHEGVFLCEPRRAYRLLYGAKAMKAPSYDTAAVLGGTLRADMDVYSLGRQEDNPDYSSSLLARAGAGRILLGIAVVLMVVLLIWLIARAVRHVDAVQEE